MAEPARPSTDPIEIPGPWQHRHVAANGARFHVAEAGPADGPLVLLLHGFPEFWWAWRDQLPALAAAGYRAVAMDLRGYGGSDKTPDGYDPVTLAQDVSGVVKALGGPQRGARRARLGRVRRLGDRRAAPARGVRARRGLGAAPGRDAAAACGPAASAAAARAGDAAAAGYPSDGSPTRRQRVPARPPAGLERSRLRLPGRATRSRRTSGRSRCGRPRTARWSTTAGCSARGCAPTGDGSAG